MTTLKNTLRNFKNFQKHTVASSVNGLNKEVGDSFLNFILKTLPDTPDNSKVILPAKKSTNKTLATMAKTYWDLNAKKWAYKESFPNYYIIMTVIHTWILDHDFRENILSVGSGPGLYELYMEQEFLDLFKKFYCTDISEKMIDQAKLNQLRVNLDPKKNSRIEHKVCRADSLPFKNGSMDLILCIKTLQWSTKWSSTLDEINRVLVEGGVLIIVTSNSEVSFRDENGETRAFSKAIKVSEIVEYLENGFLYTVYGYHEIKLPFGYGTGKGESNDFMICAIKHKL